MLNIDSPPEFISFEKLARWHKPMIITEKIDGTNGQICIKDGKLFVGSRSRWLTPQSDNFGFCKWAYEHEAELLQLGEGRHWGEWWGKGIQRGYGLQERRFSLFDVTRWTEHGKDLRGWITDEVRGVITLTKSAPPCCHVVPVLYTGSFDEVMVMNTMKGLRTIGSEAARGWMEPEGIVVFHTAAKRNFKLTYDGPKYAREDAGCQETLRVAA